MLKNILLISCLLFPVSCASVPADGTKCKIKYVRTSIDVTEIEVCEVPLK